jgi:serine/threonine-protein kinase
VLERQEARRGSKAPLWLTAAALVLLVGAGFAFRGAIGEFLMRSDDPANAAALQPTEAASIATTSADNTAASTAAAQTSQQPATSAAPGSIATLSQAAGAPSDAPPAADTRDTGALERGDLAGPAAAADSGLATPGQAQHEANATAQPRSPLAKALLAKRDGDGAQLARVDPPKPAARPVPPRVAVVALGDRALSDTAKQRVEERLLAEGFDVLDTELLGGLQGRELDAILQKLRREATMLVVVRADPIGQQQLSAYGEYFTLYSANLSVRAYLVGERRPLGAGFREKVDFTTLNLNENTREVLAPHLAQLLRELAPHRTRRAAG